MRGYPDAADRGATRAAVSLQHVAVEPERPLAERLEVGNRADGAPDQPLDLDRAPLLASGARLARGAVAGRRRQQRILGRHPTLALASNHLGTRSSTDAVQSTSSCPGRRGRSRAAAPGSRERSRTAAADPVVRPSFLMPPCAPGRRRPRARRRLWATAESGRPSCGRLRVARGQEAVGALPVCACLDALPGERLRDLPGRLLRGEDERDAAPEDPLEVGE